MSQGSQIVERDRDGANGDENGRSNDRGKN